MYPAVSSVTADILCIPCTSAPVKRVFSTAGHATGGKQNRLSSKNLECEILVRKRITSIVNTN